MQSELEHWLETLDLEKAKAILREVIPFLENSEDVRFSDEGSPYWRSCGENLGDN